MAFIPSDDVDALLGRANNAAILSGLGVTTIGNALATLANPGAITFPRLNADNTATALSAANYRTALGLGTGDSPTFTDFTLTGAGTVSSLNSPTGNTWRMKIGTFNAISANVNVFGIGGVLGLGATGGNAATVYLHPGTEILEQRNGTNAQTFRLYNTYTDASNYERAVFGFASNVLRIGTENAGTGATRAIDFVVGGTARWGISTSGHLLATADNTYDIGASGANRPRNIYLSGASSSAPRFTITSDYLILPNGSTLGIAFAGGCYISGNSTQNVILRNNTLDGFNLLMFGGTTSSFPALKRSTTTLQARLADDSDFAAVQTLYQRFGSGTPEAAVTAPVGAVYHRTDGGAGTSFYVKESGTGNTGWVAK